jgi:uncharacterized protein with PIN domain
MKFLFAILMFATVQSYAATKMGPEAVEMFSVLSHHQVVDCLQRADVNMINISIEKTVARCPGCNTYVITGNKRNIDTPSPEKTVITLKGKAVPGTFRGFIQTYACDIKE